MITMIATIVTPSVSTAQIFFLIAIIILAIDILLAIMAPQAPAWGIPVLGAVALLFIALGLLWHP